MQDRNELKPYIDMIDIVFVDLNDWELSEEIFRKALSVTEDDKNQHTLNIMYELSKTKLAKGEWYMGRFGISPWAQRRRNSTRIPYCLCR